MTVASLISVIVPAFNEAAVIADTLSPLAEAAERGEIEVIVVPNNCSDDTSARARAICPAAMVLESSIPGKANAINIGAVHARGEALVFLDADLIVSEGAIRDLCAPVIEGLAQASCGRMQVDLQGADWAVRQFYKGWSFSPYHDAGKFGGLFALSMPLAKRIFPIPNVIADDEYISRRVPHGQTQFVHESSFTVFAPRRFADLIKIRKRSRRGTLQLETLQIEAGTRQIGGGAFQTIFRRAARRPTAWAGVLVYTLIILYVRFSVKSDLSQLHVCCWERDESSRQRQVQLEVGE